MVPTGDYPSCWNAAPKGGKALGIPEDEVRAAARRWQSLQGACLVGGLCPVSTGSPRSQPAQLSSFRPVRHSTSQCAAAQPGQKRTAHSKAKQSTALLNCTRAATGSRSTRPRTPFPLGLKPRVNHEPPFPRGCLPSTGMLNRRGLIRSILNNSSSRPWPITLLQGRRHHLV